MSIRYRYKKEAFLDAVVARLKDGDAAKKIGGADFVEKIEKNLRQMINDFAVTALMRGMFKSRFSVRYFDVTGCTTSGECPVPAKMSSGSGWQKLSSIDEDLDQEDISDEVEKTDKQFAIEYDAESEVYRFDLGTISW